jgi:hypothetical protein
MDKLTPQDLWPLETYARMRGDFRARVMAHKRDRQLLLGEHLRLLFEDRTTVQYQVQEMLRIEKLFEEAEIRDELDAYNPLIPDGSNWKATLMIEIADVPERRRRLQAMVGVEHRVWIQVGTLEPVFAIADEDMERSNEEKTSSVHFLRFELTPAMRSAATRGRALHAGVDHPACSIAGQLIDLGLQRALQGDLSPRH